MSIAPVRLAMMSSFSTISGVNVPSDPLPHEIEDKTILLFPRQDASGSIAKGSVPRSVSVQGDSIMQIEYHRRIPYEHLGSTIGDITSMVDTISEICWKEHAGGKFDGTIFAITRFALMHLGELGWNEWTFGARLEVSFTHLTNVIA